MTEKTKEPPYRHQAKIQELFVKRRFHMAQIGIHEKIVGSIDKEIYEINNRQLKMDLKEKKC